MNFGRNFFTFVAMALSGSACAGVFDGVPVGGEVTLKSLSVEGAKSLPQELTFERIDVYAKDARVLESNPDGTWREVPRSTLRFFVTDKKHMFTRMWLAVSEDGKEFTGTLFDDGGTRSFHGDVGKRGLVVHKGSEIEKSGDYTCGNDLHEMGDPTTPADTSPLKGLSFAKGAVTHQAVIAVDTDNEFMSLKFGNNTTTAGNYIAALFVGMNVFYERDLNIRLTQGTTFLRTTPDPYAQTMLDPQLDEFSGVWKDTPALQGVTRAFAMLLSGKSTNDFGASGIAWQLPNHNYCAQKGTVIQNGIFGHYSVIQVFKFNGSTANSDVGIIGHELGHNFGANHTHCTNIATGAEPTGTNTIDQCFSGEGAFGCYNGPVSCPNDNSVPNQGSLMSYCNFSNRGVGGAAPCPGNGNQVVREFHPTQEATLGVRVAANINNGCFTPLVVLPPNTIFRNGFE